MIVTQHSLFISMVAEKNLCVAQTVASVAKCRGETVFFGIFCFLFCHGLGRNAKKQKVAFETKSYRNGTSPWDVHEHQPLATTSKYYLQDDEVTLVCFAAVLAYQVFAGPYLLPNEKVGLIRTAPDKAASMMAEVYVAPDSRAVGKSVGEVMNSLGVAPSSVIKIRRRVEHTGLTDADGSPKPSASRFGASIVDVRYIKKYASFVGCEGSQGADWS
jgi:hypothetical protein